MELGRNKRVIRDLSGKTLQRFHFMLIRCIDDRFGCVRFDEKIGKAEVGVRWEEG